jgi:hypothetical protein
MEDQMQVNVGTIDRVARTILGLALIAFAIPLGFPDTGWNWIGWIGFIPLLTAVVGYCPAYTVLGISSCPRPRTRGPDRTAIVQR